MKVQDKQAIDEHGQLKYIRRERSILTQVADHPFIVKIEESFQNAAKLFIVLDYCPCGDLSRVLSLQGGKRLSEDQMRPYIYELILAVKHLHSLDIMYRDLKPDNILISADGHLKLTDFGLSKQLGNGKDGAPEYNRSDSVCGSTAYMTPEMLKR